MSTLCSSTVEMTQAANEGHCPANEPPHSQSCLRQESTGTDVYGLQQAPEPEEADDEAHSESPHHEPPVMHRSLSGRYKNPTTDSRQPFGIEGRPHHPLSEAQRYSS